MKDVLPLTEQLIRFRIGIGEILAFHSAVFEKADVEKIPLETAAYRIAEDIRDYRQLGGFKREHDKAIQQICMLNAVVAAGNNGFVPIVEYENNGRPDIQYGSADEQWTTSDSCIAELTWTRFCTNK